MITFHFHLQPQFNELFHILYIKEAYGKLSFQKNTEDSHSERERTLALVSDLPACSSERDASITTEGPLRKDGKPDMRFKINKEAYGKSSFQKNMEDSHSESEQTLALFSHLPAFSWERDARKPASPAETSRSAVTSSSCEFKGPLKKDGTPDMRFASNNQSASSMSSLSSNSSASGPIKKDSAPDMRYAENKSSYDGSLYSTELLASLASPGTLKSDGTPDMRYAANRSSYAIPYSFGGSTYSSGSSSIDGTPDMRYVANNSFYDACSWERDARKPASPAQISRSAVTSSSCEFKGPMKKDGTPDMRFASNNQSASSMSSLSSYSNTSGPIKKDNAPDMRYAANKSSYDGPSPSGYWSGGSFYSTELLASLASPGPLKSDGTPDMRYAANRSSYASPCSYGGSAYTAPDRLPLMAHQVAHHI